MRVFFHVQHLLGIGHLKRAAALTRALRAAGFEVVLASGGFPVKGVEVSVQLPPLRAVDASFKTLVDERGAEIDDAWKRRRSAALLDAWRASHADVLMVELFPFGRMQMRFELVPLLEDAKRLAPAPLVVCSLRDLIQAKPKRAEETLELVRYFDRVLVHGDPRLAPLERTFPGAARIGERIHYTGYVVDEVPSESQTGRGEVLVSAGGGAVGARLFGAALEARSRTLLRGATWRVLAGVQASDADLRALERAAPGGVVVERSRDDFPRLLASCALSISQAGYNTVAETLQARVRAVLVPFAAAGELEQTLRARLLAERGAVEMVEEAALTPESLAEAVNRAARGSRPPPGLVDLSGARRSAELLRSWVH